MRRTRESLWWKGGLCQAKNAVNILAKNFFPFKFSEVTT